MSMRFRVRAACLTVVVGGLGAGLFGNARASAQIAQGAPPPPAAEQPARTTAPIDYTGYWASVVTEDWQWRFVTPIVGDYTAVPLNSAGDKLARAWDNDADVAAGNQCKAFGAAAIMRLPTRLQISWQDDSTLKLDWDLGTQSRLAHFDKSKQAGARSWQGHAVAEWISLPPPGRGGGAPPAPAPAAGAATAPEGGRAGAAGAAAPPAGGRAGAAGRGGAGRGRGAVARQGGLRIVTTNLRGQYLRMNGVPVSEKAVVTDYLDVVPGPDGSQWLIVKTIVEDPTYLTQPYITSAQFKKEPDGGKWNPTACELLPRLKNTATQVPRQSGD